jgi:hypothetical protein
MLMGHSLGPCNAIVTQKQTLKSSHIEQIYHKIIIQAALNVLCLITSSIKNDHCKKIS